MRPLIQPTPAPALVPGITAPFTVPIGPDLLYEIRLMIGPLEGGSGGATASIIDHDQQVITLDIRVPLHALPLVAAACVATAWQQVLAGETAET